MLRFIFLIIGDGNEFQNLQNKKFSMNLNITGRDQQELFDNYKDANQLLHNCITY